jgi:hypothetical protein
VPRQLSPEEVAELGLEAPKPKARKLSPDEVAQLGLETSKFDAADKTREQPLDEGLPAAPAVEPTFLDELSNSPQITGISQGGTYNFVDEAAKTLTDTFSGHVPARIPGKPANPTLGEALEAKMRGAYGKAQKESPRATLVSEVGAGVGRDFVAGKAGLPVASPIFQGLSGAASGIGRGEGAIDSALQGAVGGIGGVVGAKYVGPLLSRLGSKAVSSIKGAIPSLNTPTGLALPPSPAQTAASKRIEALLAPFKREVDEANQTAVDQFAKLPAEAEDLAQQSVLKSQGASNARIAKGNAAETKDYTKALGKHEAEVAASEEAEKAAMQKALAEISAESKGIAKTNAKRAEGFETESWNAAKRYSTEKANPAPMTEWDRKVAKSAAELKRAENAVEKEVSSKAHREAQAWQGQYQGRHLYGDAVPPHQMTADMKVRADFLNKKAGEKAGDFLTGELPEDIAKREYDKAIELAREELAKQQTAHAALSAKPPTVPVPEVPDVDPMLYKTLVHDNMSEASKVGYLKPVPQMDPASKNTLAKAKLSDPQWVAENLGPAAPKPVGLPPAQIEPTPIPPPLKASQAREIGIEDVLSDPEFLLKNKPDLARKLAAGPATKPMPSDDELAQLLSTDKKAQSFNPVRATLGGPVLKAYEVYKAVTPNPSAQELYTSAVKDLATKGPMGAVLGGQVGGETKRIADVTADDFINWLTENKKLKAD